MNNWQRPNDGQQAFEQQRQREEQLRQREEQLRQLEQERLLFEEHLRQQEQEQRLLEERLRQLEQEHERLFLEGRLREPDRFDPSSTADRGFLSRWFGRKSAKSAATKPAPGGRSASRPRRR